MKVLVAGATGVIGRQVVPLLAEVGYEVVELVRPGREGGRQRGQVAVAVANLVAAAPDARFVVESLAYAYRPTGGPQADEDQPLWVDGPRQFRPVAEAIVEHERRARDVDAAVLRFGHLDGPGKLVRDRRVVRRAGPGGQGAGGRRWRRRVLVHPRARRGHRRGRRPRQAVPGRHQHRRGRPRADARLAPRAGRHPGRTGGRRST